MKEANRNYTAVGAFVLTMLAVLITWFTALSGVTGSTDRYYILWDNVMGLKPGTQIFFEGYQIGIITDIGRFDRANGGGKNYRVDIEVDKGWPIPDSAVAETTAPSFLAALVVNIESGDSSTNLTPKSQIQSVEPADLLGMATGAMARLSGTLDSIKPKIESITNSVSSILSEQNARQIEELLQTLNDRVNEMLSAENADRITTILTNLSDVSRTVADLTEGLQVTKQQVDEILTTVDTLIDDHKDDVAHSLVDLHASLETVSRHIDAVANNLEGATRNLNEFGGQIREDPSLLLRRRETNDQGAGTN
jgi:phospholipid/cholesterol/gamma-HCH transport system substrate-binding protein